MGLSKLVNEQRSGRRGLDSCRNGELERVCGSNVLVQTNEQDCSVVLCFTRSAARFAALVAAQALLLLV